jgi:PAS domain-containing protein
VDFFVRVIWQESRFNATAVSPKGAQGIAQFMPTTADWRGLSNPFDVDAALVAAASYLHDLHKRRFIEVNQPACNMFGYTKGELIGQDVDTLSSGVHPHTRDMEKATQPTDAFDFADLVGHALFEMLV